MLFINKILVYFQMLLSYLQFMVLNMLSEHMTIQQVVSLSLNLDSALALNLESRCSWEQHIWILSSLENSLSANQQTTMVTHII